MMQRRKFLQIVTSLSGLANVAAEKSRSLPAFRIVDEGWGDARVEDLSNVTRNVINVFWPLFPNAKLEPFVIMRNRSTPMVHFTRNVRKEIVMDLNVEGRRWSQFAYQFAHEFCHLLAGFDDDYDGNLWFEESLCEAASLYALRQMASQWRTNPPDPNWQNYANHLDDYANDVVKSREKIQPGALAQFYSKHTSTLRTSPGRRSLNGAISLVLLPYFQAVPQRWEAISWLNSTPSPEGESFAAYLDKWLHACPARYQSFVAEISRLFGMR